jgi:Fe-S-cluster containining protein
MHSIQSTAALKALYSWHDVWSADFPRACGPGCATCCTANVSLTSLEARYLVAAPLFQETVGMDEKNRCLAAGPLYRPTSTINQVAACCLAHQEPPEDTSEHVGGVCLFLDDLRQCRIYAHRPMACRAMTSRVRCRSGSEAMVEPFVLTVNLALHQIIEHLDQEGVFGSLPEVVALVMGGGVERPLPVNQPLPGFLVPFDEQERFNDLLRALADWPVGGGRFGDHLPASQLRF